MPNSYQGEEIDYVDLFAHEEFGDIEEAILQEEWDRVMEDRPIKTMWLDDDTYNYKHCCCDYCNDRWGVARPNQHQPDQRLNMYKRTSRIAYPDQEIDWDASYTKRRKLD